MTNPQHRAIGVEPTLAQLSSAPFCAPRPTGFMQTVTYVEMDDFDELARPVLLAVKRLAQQGVPPSPQLVIDELRRTGKLTRERGYGWRLRLPAVHVPRRHVPTQPQ